MKIREEMFFKNSFGFIHTPIRYWDLRYLFNFKLDSSDFFLTRTPKNILIGEEISRRYLETYTNLKSKVLKVEALRFLSTKKKNNLEPQNSLGVKNLEF